MRIRIQKSVAFILALCVAFSVLFNVDVKAEESSFWIEFIDVGQGDAALVCCDGHYMLIDGGPAGASSVIYTILKENKIEHLDYIIASHQDADHIGGLSGALNYADVTTCYCPVISYDSKTFFNLLRYLGSHNASVTVPMCGTAFKLGSAKVQIIGPVFTSQDSNEDSIVTRITYGDNSFLFMGDAGIEEENDIIDNTDDLTCDLIKVGHHGSKYSTSGDLLDLANPVYAVVSVGKNNTYGHPAKETIKRLKDKKITVYRTDTDGDIICTSDGTNLSFTTKKYKK